MLNRRALLRRSAAVAGASIWGTVLEWPGGTAGSKNGKAMRGLEAQKLGPDELFREDFTGFPAGKLSEPIDQLNGAIQEVHYLSNRGVPLGPWDNVLTYQDAWVIGDEHGAPYLEQHLVNDRAALTNAIFLTGEAEWSDYTVEANVKPLSLAQMSGIVFRYHTNRHYYLFAITGGNQAVLRIRLPLEKQFRIAEWRELGSKKYAYGTDRYLALKVENDGPNIRASIDGELIFDVRDSEILKGKAGLTANIPTRFTRFRVTTKKKQEAISRVERVRSELKAAQAENPKPKLWRKFETPKYGAGRSVRFGDLDGDGKLEMLFAQNTPRVAGDGFDQISCLTAVTLDGKVLWQSGKPDPRNGLLTNDLPVQIHDVDGDARNEVVTVRDFQLQICDGQTGKIKRWVWMPAMPPDSPRRPYERENGDCVAFVNFSGDKARRDILVKDRYWHFWIFNNKLELLWGGQGQTGHFPYPLDIDGDGRDELMIGYSLWDHEGHQLWSHDKELHDHADAVALGNFTGDSKGEVCGYSCGSDEGFLVFDSKGDISNHVRVGHAQNMAIGKFRKDLAGLQFMVVNFWNDPGIVTLFDHTGKILAQEEPIHCGSPMMPVNWRGDGEEFVMLSGNVREGGMLDGQLRRVVTFPEDGHPDLSCYAVDLTGDPRDEIVLWDTERVWIYTQDADFSGSRIYAPVRNPLYNESNYRAAISIPNWSDHK